MVISLYLAPVAILLVITGGAALGLQFAFLRYRTKKEDRGKSISLPGIVTALIFLWVGLLFYGGRMVAGALDPSLVGAANTTALVSGFVYWVFFSFATGVGYEWSQRIFERREREKEEKEQDVQTEVRL
jgi:hypothetical protein